MTKQATILRVFVASPSDVAEERSALEGIVTELNRTWSKHQGVKIELVKWETHVQPGFGGDPQDVINQQVNDDYDIFIGLFWGRVGTPTKRALSGTIEEFERALAMYNDNNDSVDIMLYFKDAPIKPSKLDSDQFKELMKFKDTLGELGSLYWSFDSMNDFEVTLRTHLSLAMQKWSGQDHLSVERKAYSNTVDEEVEGGFFDYLESFTELNDQMCSALVHLIDSTEEIGFDMVERTKELEEVGKSSSKEDLEKAKKIVKQTSLDMNRYASSINKYLPIMTSSRKGAMDALSKALVVYSDFNGSLSDIENLERSVNEMRESAINAQNTSKDFQVTISNLPRVTTQFNRAKRSVVKALDGVLAELGATAQVTQSTLVSLNTLKVELQ